MDDYTGPERRRHPPRCGWRSTWLGLIVGRFWSLIAYSDTTPTRFMLALAATFWAILLYLPGETFGRPVYRYMALVASEETWASFWALHAIGMWWRIFSAVDRPRLALAIHMLGAMLFTAAAVSIYLSRLYPIPAGIAPDVVLALAAGWVLVRTQVHSEKGWRRD